MSYEKYQEQNPSLWAKTNGLFGAGQEGIERLFRSGSGYAPTASAPFPGQARGSHIRAYFNKQAIEDAVRARQYEEIDPRGLMKIQHGITDAGMRYYMGDEYDLTGKTWKDHGAGNAVPVIYEADHPHFGWTERSILSGHHRATADLLKGRPLRAVLVRSPYLK